MNFAPLLSPAHFRKWEELHPAATRQPECVSTHCCPLYADPTQGLINVRANAAGAVRSHEFSAQPLRGALAQGTTQSCRHSSEPTAAPPMVDQESLWYFQQYTLQCLFCLSVGVAEKCSGLISGWISFGKLPLQLYVNHSEAERKHLRISDPVVGGPDVVPGCQSRVRRTETETLVNRKAAGEQLFVLWW